MFYAECAVVNHCKKRGGSLPFRTHAGVVHDAELPRTERERIYSEASGETETEGKADSISFSRRFR